MDLSYPVEFKPDDHPWLAEVIYLLVLPYLQEKTARVDSPPHLNLLTQIAETVWNLSRVEGDPEAVPLAKEMRATYCRVHPGLERVMDDLLARARLVSPLMPATESLSMIFKGGKLIITAIPVLPWRGLGSKPD